MPHIVLEYSSNLKTKPSAGLLAQLHELLPAIGPFDRSSIKSRIVEHTEFCVADGNPTSAFVHLQLAILSGRDLQTKQKVSEGLAAKLQQYFAEAMSTQQISLTVEIRELATQCYSKISTIRETLR